MPNNNKKMLEYIVFAEHLSSSPYTCMALARLTFTYWKLFIEGPTENTTSIWWQLWAGANHFRKCGEPCVLRNQKENVPYCEMNWEECRLGRGRRGHIHYAPKMVHICCKMFVSRAFLHSSPIISICTSIVRKTSEFRRARMRANYECVH